jgi:hypothetical protein
MASAGASQLRPAPERDPYVTTERIELPDSGKLADHRSRCSGSVAAVNRRSVPNAPPRMLSCTWLASRIDTKSLLPLRGDLVRGLFFSVRQHFFNPQICAGTEHWISKEMNLCCRLFKRAAFVKDLGWLQVLHAASKHQNTDESKYHRDGLRFMGALGGSPC